MIDFAVIFSFFQRLLFYYDYLILFLFHKTGAKFATWLVLHVISHSVQHFAWISLLNARVLMTTYIVNLLLSCFHSFNLLLVLSLQL